MAGVTRFVSVAALVLSVAVASDSIAQTLSVVHAFDGVAAGNPAAGLTLGADGYLYGTAEAPAPGALFRVRPDGSGFAVLHTFAAGTAPSHAALARGPGNAFFGTTLTGGASGLGSVYRVEILGTSVNVTTLHEFSAPDGYPDGGVIVASDGMLYGTFGAGSTTTNAVYAVAQDGTGYRVVSDLQNGTRPTGTLIEGSDGVLYGTTERGGTFNAGTVFRVGRDGLGFAQIAQLEGYPVAGVTEAPGPGGNRYLYGVEERGSTATTQFGTVFRLRPDGTSFLRTGLFTGTDRDGMSPKSPLLLGRDGLLYGTASDSLGCPNGNCGTVYRLSPAGSPFAIAAFPLLSGWAPTGALVQGPDGALYGTAPQGGPSSTDPGILGDGVVFTVRNPSLVPLVFTGPGIADEGDVAIHTLTLRNTTNTILTAPLDVVVARSAGLVFSADSSDGWTCVPQPDGTVHCRWATDLAAGADSDTHTLTFVPTAPFDANCGLAPSPCAHVTAALANSGAATRVTTTIRALVNGQLNSPPTPVDDTLPVFGTAQAVLRVLDNDTDPDGDTLLVTAVYEGPRFGSVSFNQDGTITYTPFATLVEPDTFLYQVSDLKFPTAARATARVTIVPSTANAAQTKTRIDLGDVAVGRFAAGRFHVEVNVSAQLRLSLEPVTAGEIATALQGTAHDPSRAVSDPGAFRQRFTNFTTDPAQPLNSPTLTTYYRAPTDVGRVSVAKIVATIAVDGLPDMARSVLIVGASADAASAPLRAADDFTATPQGTTVWYDVLANDGGDSATGRRLYVSSVGCGAYGAFGPCNEPGTYGGSGPSSIFGPQDVALSPPPSGTGSVLD